MVSTRVFGSLSPRSNRSGTTCLWRRTRRRRVLLSVYAPGAWNRGCHLPTDVMRWAPRPGITTQFRATHSPVPGFSPRMCRASSIALITHKIDPNRSLDFVMVFRHTGSSSQCQRGSHDNLIFEFNTACFRRQKTVSLQQRKRPPHKGGLFSSPATPSIASMRQKSPQFLAKLP